jgi:simple sugar transport system ATP-binding protein
MIDTAVPAIPTLSGGKPPHIELFKLTKRFGTFTALDNVSLTLKPGSFHVLLGENGAGKSTLVKALMGYHRADEGAVMVDGLEVVMANPKDAHAHGIGMVYQHFTLVPNFTVAENLVLSRDHLPVIIDWAAEKRALDAFMATMPFRLPLERPVASLAAGEKQKLEILKQLYLKRTVIILDEPTSVLTQGEADDILGLLKRMTVEGGLSILMISHKFREVMAFGDEITVLRKGRFAGNGLVKDLTPAQMADMMMGGAHVTPAAARGDAFVGEIRLATEDLRANDDTGVGAVNGVSFEVRSGEILGVAGVSGNGQKQLVEVLAGQRPATGGKVLVDGKLYYASRSESSAHKVHILPEEPLRNACVGDMSVSDNLGFRRFDRSPNTWLHWLVNRGSLRATAADLISRFAIKTTGVDAPIASLSGGNVQRGVLAREVNDEVRVLIVANPCFGLDFKAVAEIRNRIMQARNRGVAVLLVSEDLDELFELADRLVVMSGGKFVHEALPAQTNPAELGGHMAGHH